MYGAILSLALLAPAQSPAGNDAGVLPVGADGRPLNLDFETGTLKDWTATGTAFRDQPIKGDTVAARRGDMKSRHQGEFWIGGYEKHGDKGTGTLTSVPFKVTHPWASFLVGGGPFELDTCVELVDVAGKAVFFRAAGLEEEDLRRVVVDLSKVQGKDIQVRVVDKHAGGWGHVNFDDFRFHAARPSFPARAQKAPPPPKDVVAHAGLAPEAAAKAMTVPDGFKVTLFAGEPDVHQPIAFCFDDRGRMWVAEAYTYPKRHPHPGPILPADQKKLGDRIIIFEDADGDGKFDKRTVFLEGLNLVSGLEVGFGGVWIGAAPYLLFVPHDEATDRAGEPRILLDGWGYQDTHETLNTFVWGPDGWLYGCHGVFTHSRVGKPGTPDAQRTPINAGVWRYHPTRHVFEVFAHGTSNPWGLDYNAHGEFFVEACVIPHMWHIVQGGRYHRQGGQHFNPFTFADIQTIALHRHYLGATPHGGNNVSDAAGGGHAHSGLMCYQGGAWPKEYHGKLFMGNLHGHRINMDVLTPKGSGYVADRNPDFLKTNDKWSMLVNIRSGPDGNAFAIDWYDKQICHRNEPEIWDRTNGRIFKISYQGTKNVAGLDLKKLSDEQLVKLQLHENVWFVRHARRILQERAVGRKLDDWNAVLPALGLLALEDKDATRRLRGLWALNACGLLTHGIMQRGLQDEDPHVRGWVVRLRLDAMRIHGVAGGAADRGDLALLTRAGQSPVIRRYLASELQRLPNQVRWKELEALLAHPEDAADHNLPYLYWYAMEPLAEVDAPRALKLAADAKVPQLLPLMARRIGTLGTPDAIGLLVKAAGESGDGATQLALLRGLQDGLKGKRQFPMPREWGAAFPVLLKSSSADVRGQAQALAVVFGDRSAFAALRTVVADAKADAAARAAALASLVDAKDAELPPVLHALVKDAALRGAAIRGLAAFDDAKTPGVILGGYAAYTPAEKRDALATLSARTPYAKELMAAVADKRVPVADVSAETVRQLRNLQDAGVDEQIAKLWGVVRATPADRLKLIGEWRAKLIAPTKAAPDLNLGRAVFAKTCQQCHTLYGVGGKVGPDITGSNRANLDYLLENIFDPSAVIPNEYAATRFNLTDGRVITGILKGQTPAAVTVQTENETLVIPAGDIDQRTPSTLSMMPDDILKATTEFEVRSLFAYLQAPAQVPMLATADNAKDFFNGKDLTGWDGDAAVWGVQNGEIVGKTATGLKRNTFLKSPLAVTDFKLALKVKLTPNRENSGIQFRSVPLPDGEMRGPQADIGAGWWGKLYEESGRGLLAKEGGERHVKPDEWNDYVVEARGPTVKIWINGQLVCDYTDQLLSRRGVIGLQVHSGGPMEVRFKDLRLEVLPPAPAAPR